MNKWLIAATAGGVAIGGGAAFLAPTMAADDSGHQATAAQQRHHRHHGLGLRHARGVIHAQWTTRNGAQHEAIRGDVTAVSAQAITVRAKDGVTQTYTVTPDTKVRVVGDQHRGEDSIDDVKNGEKALVVGKDDHQARRIVALVPKAQRSGGTTHD